MLNFEKNLNQTGEKKKPRISINFQGRDFYLL